MVGAYSGTQERGSVGLAKNPLSQFYPTSHLVPSFGLRRTGVVINDLYGLRLLDSGQTGRIGEFAVGFGEPRERRRAMGRTDQESHESAALARPSIAYRWQQSFGVPQRFHAQMVHPSDLDQIPGSFSEPLKIGDQVNNCIKARDSVWELKRLSQPIKELVTTVDSRQVSVNDAILLSPEDRLQLSCFGPIHPRKDCHIWLGMSVYDRICASG